MKRAYSFILLAAVFAASTAFIGCQRDGSDVLRVGATPVPHAELLNLIVGDLAEMGVRLQVVEFTDFITPNIALMDGSIDANFFQHLPFLQGNADWYNNLVSVFGVHVEPFGLYSLRFNSIDELPQGASIAIPNDPTNGGRALLLLQARGLITLREGAGLSAVPADIASNPRGFVFHPLEAAHLPRALEDVDAATINGNFAMQAGFNPQRDSLIIEDGDSPYVNVVVVQRGDENDPRILALREALLSPRVREFIYARYDGGVVPVF
ncbi:MAG: MetQ/NlpA family ABC transporter substrate-binding protein [Treponema sp.]|jgi:D-methionine transport system substrate-binding protein|nr:MetQ/NlpA family ABC transporter substrate-binding protein [Treponema sp.]MDR0512093.1 MetQ/NlpA family ABC transporter substrate-binding protein [Treponema sp.]